MKIYYYKSKYGSDVVTSYEKFDLEAMEADIGEPDSITYLGYQEIELKTDE